jgi:hypothetical protein
VKLIPDNHTIPKPYEQDGLAEEAIAHVKLFATGGRFSYFVTEFDGDDRLFGYCISPLGRDCDEFGYQSLSELQNLRVGMVVIERDLSFRPCPIAEAVDRQLSLHGEPARFGTGA